MKKTVIAWLEALRISNQPTLLTQAMLGIFAAKTLVESEDKILWLVYTLAAMSLLLFYAGGMLLNDAFDAKIDAIERPQRPIPSRRLKQAHVCVAGFVLIGIALGLCTIEGDIAHMVLGATLTLCIIAYNSLHKYAWSVCLMALCRVFAVIVTASFYATTSWHSPWLWGLAAFSGAWTIGLSLAARAEAQPKTRSLAPVAMPILALCLTAVYVWLSIPLHHTELTLAIGMGLLLTGACVWHGRHLHGESPKPPKAIMGWIACFCLLDALLLSLLAPVCIALTCIIGWYMTLLLQRRIAGS